MKSLLFSPPMVKALLSGVKTQTRRVLNPQPPEGYSDVTHNHAKDRWYWANDGGLGDDVKLRLQPGDVVFVKESFYIDWIPYSEKGPLPKVKPEGIDDSIYYHADGECCQQIPECQCASMGKLRWRNPFFMTAWASRIFLRIESVKVERAWNISDADVKAEGFTSRQEMISSWDANPWVAAYTFSRVERPEGS